MRPQRAVSVSPSLMPTTRQERGAAWVRRGEKARRQESSNARECMKNREIGRMAEPIEAT